MRIKSKKSRQYCFKIIPPEPELLLIFYSILYHFSIAGIKKGRILYVPEKSLHVETFLEAIDTSASINQLLFARVEGMAFGANINLHFLLGGAGLKRFTAHAANNALAVLGMDVFLHCCFTSFAYAMAVNRKTYLTIIVDRLQVFFLCF